MEMLFDLSELREMSGNDEEFVQEMIQSFIDNNSTYLNQMIDAGKSGDWAAVKFNAHKIKPSILLFKIESLQKAILDLNEFAGKEINTDSIPQLISEIEAGLKKVFGQLTD